jgi:hypothetical protein
VRGIAIAAATLALSLGSCIARSDGGGHAYSALNDTDTAVIVQVRTTETRTIVIPPHTYVGLAAGWSNIDPSWTITAWDSQCHLLRTGPITVGGGVLYVGSDSRVEWRADTSSASPYLSQDNPLPTACPPG